MKIRVLLADDHTLVREGIRSLLQASQDIDVVGEASDGDIAVQKARELKPDVVVMDISMPTMSGVEATRQILKENPAIKVVILSRYDNLLYARSLLEAGASAYLPKKAVSTELASAIRAVQSGEVFLHPSIAKGVVQDYVRLVQSEQKTEPVEQLTDREREILRLIAEGCSSHQIAEKLFISVKTVLNYRNIMMNKLGFKNSAQLIKYAMKTGLIDEEM